MFCVYSCGSNGRFQLGDGSDEDSNRLKKVFESNIRPTKVVCGGNHTFILLENGDLLAAGDDTFGQCGIDPSSISTEEKRITKFTEVPKVNAVPWIGVSAGFEYSIFVNEKQELFSAGFGLKGELGLGNGNSKSLRLSKIEADFKSDVLEIKSCLDHTVVLLKSLQTYGWGSGRSGKLGQPADSKIWSPRPLESPYAATTHLEVGRDFTVLGDSEGNLCILGKDKFNISSQSPHRWMSFNAMWSSLHFVDELGQIISIENDSHGQLIPEKHANYSLFEVGSEHGIVADGQTIKSWGWGEHGNCGINKIDSVTFNYLNELHEFPKTEGIIMIKGGCATTWVVTERLTLTN